jgi:hypothetical protein
MKHAIHIALIAGGLCMQPLLAQVRVNAAIQLEGSSEEQRQVLGLPGTNEAGELLSTGLEQSGAHRLALPDAGPVWTAELPGLSGTLLPGTSIVVNAPQPSAGSPALLVNGQGPFPLITDTDGSIAGEDIPVGTMLSLVFDGDAFQVLNGVVHTRRPCPAGTVPVNEHFCMQTEENSPSATYFDAVLICDTMGLRLCSWAEFVVACEKREELDIPDLVGNWEWTRTTAGSNNVLRMVGSNNCASASTASANPGNLLRRWHCCASR